MNFGSICLIVLQYVFSSAAKDFYNKTFCVGKPSGLHADPEDCRAYYDCNNGRTRHRTGLSTGLMFDPKSKNFLHSWEMDCAVKKVYRELWINVPGSSVTDLESSSLYPCAPSKTQFIDTFCVYNPDSGDYYGQRLRSFFRAPETGNYTFQTSCDNACQLWMSNSKLPTGKRLIVNQRVYNKRYLWDNQTTGSSPRSQDQSSEKIYLEEDKVYYMEVLHKEDIQYDFMCVGAKFPTKRKQQPISSKHLVMEGTELDLIGCRGSEQGLQDVNCEAQRCKTPDEILKVFKQSMDTKTKSLKLIPSDQSPSSLQQITQVTKESTKVINDVLREKSKEQWRRSNTSLAMEIAEITESFGKELAEKWSNKTSAVGSSEDNIVLQASVLSGDYRFSVSNMDKNWQGINDFLTLKVAGIKPEDNIKTFSVIYKSLHEKLPSSPSKVGKEKGSKVNYELNSRVIGSLVTPSAIGENLDVRVTLQHLTYKSNATYVPMCVWWDFTAGGVNSTGLWSTKGCGVDTAASNKTHSVCKCDHLTNFAVLMQIKSDSDLEVDETHAVALQIITYVGCGLSLIGVTLTVVIVLCLSGVRSERNLIHVNLSLSIGIFQIIFLAGIKATSNEVACTIVAVLLHYFLLVSFAWMLVEGVHLYVMVVTVFENSKEQLRIYGLCAYGLPGIVVLIAASVAHDGYGTDSRCWLSVSNGVIYAFVGPALAVILVNTVILVMVVREIFKVQTSGVSHSTKFDLVKSGVKSAAVLFPLLGITWLFGILALDTKTIVFQYFFAILNSLQGFFIFIFHSLLNSEVRKAMQRKKEIWFSRRTFFAPSSTIPSSAAAARASHGATLSDVNMMPLSDDPNSSHLVEDGDNIKCSPVSEKNAPHESDEQADAKPSGTFPTAREQCPAWLSKEPTEGSAKVKLPPVTVPANMKRKQKRVLNKIPRQNSKGKLNAAIEPLQEETNESNANT